MHFKLAVVQNEKILLVKNEDYLWGLFNVYISPGQWFKKAIEDYLRNNLGVRGSEKGGLYYVGSARTIPVIRVVVQECKEINAKHLEVKWFSETELNSKSSIFDLELDSLNFNTLFYGLPKPFVMHPMAIKIVKTLLKTKAEMEEDGDWQK